MYALIDCNNFFASCERLFRPDLWYKPVIVLSNNDGCVIARSNEAKALGIPMGVPFFEIKPLCHKEKIAVFSSNYTLYGDISQRVMSIIAESWNEIEIYSIDEAFLDVSTVNEKELNSFCYSLHKKIMKFVGIPTSIGIGKTKTLAKVANHIAKKKLEIPVFNSDQIEDKCLKMLNISDVWGIGPQGAKQLQSFGVHTAFDLSKVTPSLIKNKFNISIQRIVLELQGTPCHTLEMPVPRKSIVSSCSFGRLVDNIKELEQAISQHCATAWDKLRQPNLLTQHLSVFVKSNPFRLDLPQHCNSGGFRLTNPTDDLRDLTKYAKMCLHHIYQPGIKYHKSGVLLTELIHQKHYQMDIFH